MLGEGGPRWHWAVPGGRECGAGAGRTAGSQAARGAADRFYELRWGRYLGQGYPWGHGSCGPNLSPPRAVHSEEGGQEMPSNMAPRGVDSQGQV